MRSPVTIYISRVLHEKQEIFSGSCRVFQSSQEKSNTMVMQKFGGYTRFIMVLAKMVNSPFAHLPYYTLFAPKLCITYVIDFSWVLQWS